MSSREYLYIVKDPGTESFFMPQGFEANVEVHLWGAGGGDGSGAVGGGGGYTVSTVVINPSDFIELVVGGPGQAASGTSGGAGGRGSTLGFNGGSGANQGDPEDGDAGGSAGGGAGTALLINGVPVTVAAGGGGGGGYGEDLWIGGVTSGRGGGEIINASSFSALVVIDPRTGSSDNGYYTRTAAPNSDPGTSARQYIVRLRGTTVWDSGSPPPSNYIPTSYKGSVYGISAGGGITDSARQSPMGDNLNAFDLIVDGIYTNIYPVTLSRAWNSFMNSYAVWGDGQDYTVTLNFPITGIHTFNYAVDNYGQVFLDGSAIITLSGTVTSHFTTTTTYTANVAAGNHTVRVTGVNTGGPAGVAAQILKPDNTELWSTRYLILSDALTDDSNGANGRQGGSGGGGGGGGGYRGGQIGTVYGDDGPGGEGGYGGLNYGNITIAGSGTVSGGTGTTYAPTSPPYGNAGYPGYAVLVLQRKFNVSVKDDSNTWKSVKAAYVKVPEYSYTIYSTVSPTTVTYESGLHSFKVPIGVTSLTVTMIAGGGSGGGGNDYGSGAGGSGGYYSNYTYPVTPKQVISMSVGSSGENTIFGTLTCTAGGNGGLQTYDTGAAGSPNGTAGGAGGQPGPAGGAGASSPYGTGGAGGVGGGPGRTGNSGSSATGYGAGGGGGGNNKGGGGGSPGFVTISYSSPTIATITTDGGWKNINQIWTKIGLNWKSILSSNSLNVFKEKTKEYTSLLTDTFVVPSGCTKIYASLTGGGGGGGGYDRPYAGVPGFSGSVIKGIYNVSPGDTITIGVGGGGYRGGPGTGSGSGAGGNSTLGFSGGRGGNAGGSGWSGGGGGGGAASVLKLNGSIIVVASGGGGGGGGGHHSPGIATKPAYSNSGQYYGTQGQDKSGDGGGGGGGGGGYNGGSGGTTYGGDNGAYCGSDGSDLIPTGWASGKAGNQGSAYTDGQQGIIVISYYSS